MRERFIRFSEKNKLFERGDVIVVGVSGGADSVCLLHLLYDIQEAYGLSLHVLHVEHGIRGEEAERDALFAEKLAGSLGLPFCLVRKDVPRLAAERGMSVEEAGRGIRYEALEEYRERTAADRIALAHHRNDQAETVLFHLFRGSGARGISGIPAKRGAVIRPLLFAERTEIIHYLEERGLAWIEDSTNGNREYARNKIRLELLPYAEREINRQAVRHTAQAAEKLAEWRRYIESAGQRAFREMVSRRGEELLLDISRFEREDPVIQGEVLREIFERLIPGAKDVGQIHYEQVQGLLTAESGRRISLPQGTAAEKNYDHVRFFSGGEEEEELCLTCDIPSRHIVNRNGIFSKFSIEVKKRESLPGKIPEKDYTKWFDYDKMKDGLLLRSPRPGDYFILDAGGGRKKLSRYYMDRKLPRSERASQIVFADGSHVLWAFPGRISAAYKVTAATERVLVITKERT